MTPGSTVPVSLTFKNTGTTTWAPSGGYLLGSPDPANGTTWEVSVVALPSTVEPGSSVTFSFRVRAPGTPGTYDFEWQIRKSGPAFFGARSAKVFVKVQS